MDKKKVVWTYTNDKRDHHIDVFELQEHVVIIREKGISHQEGAQKLLDFLISYSKQKKHKIRMLIDTSTLNKIDSGARKIKGKILYQKDYVEKFTITGANFFVKCFVKLFSVLNKNQIPFELFDSYEDALEWLLND
jgi:hypothetical protein